MTGNEGETVKHRPHTVEFDDEEFCPRCFAGVESPEHHEKCIRPLEDLDAETSCPPVGGGV